MQEQSTLLNEDKNKQLPGAAIFFSSACSTGSSENQYGVGEMDISLHRPDNKYPWLDLGSIKYSCPTPQQLKAAENSSAFSDGQKAYGDINRRVSKLQAEYINFLIRNMLTKEFAGVIPADDEIKELMKQQKT